MIGMLWAFYMISTHSGEQYQVEGRTATATTTLGLAITIIISGIELNVGGKRTFLKSKQLKWLFENFV